MKQRGIELSASTPGTCNVIKKLFADLEKQKYGIFTPEHIRQLCTAGVQPVPDHEVIAQIAALKKSRASHAFIRQSRQFGV